MSSPAAVTAASDLQLNKDLPPLPLALGAYDHLSGNVIPLSIPWTINQPTNGKWAKMDLASNEVFKSFTATRPSAQILGDIEVTITARPSQTATALIFASVVMAITPTAHGKLDSVEALKRQPGHLAAHVTMMGGPSGGVVKFFPGAQRNLKIPGVLGHPFTVQAVAYGIGVEKLEMALKFDVEVQGWFPPAPETIVPF